MFASLRRLAFLIIFFVVYETLPEAHARDVITVTNGNDSGAGSLRTAIAGAKNGDVIEFAVSIITLTSGELFIGKNLTIDGSAGGVTISRDPASPAFRIFHLDSNKVVVLLGLEIIGGLDSTRLDRAYGGGICNRGDLTLKNCKIRGNRALELFGDGGGIYSTGRITLVDCEISGNTANGNGGGIFSTGALTFTTCAIKANHAEISGGGILSDGTATLIGCTVEMNSTDEDGGGIAGSSALRIDSCFVIKNTAAGFGGGIKSAGELSLLNSRLSENTARSGGGLYSHNNANLRKTVVIGNSVNNDGGGIANLGSLNLVNCAITGNFANFDGGGLWNIGQTTILSSTIGGNGVNGQGNSVVVVSGKVIIKSTIIAGIAPENPSDIIGTINSQDNNFISNIGSATFEAKLGDIVGTARHPTDPLFIGTAAPPTTVGDYSLSIISPAFNAGAPDTSGLDLPSEDLNGNPRVADGRIEIGAYELQLATPIVSNEAELRHVIKDSVTVRTIIFHPSVKTLTLTGGELLVERNINIDGENRVTISGGGKFRVFKIDSGSAVTMFNLTIADGQAPDSVEGGAGILNLGNLTINNCRLRKNTAANEGGAILNRSQIAIVDCAFDSNAATRSGGGVLNSGTMKLVRTTLSANIAGLGGGVFNAGIAEASGCLIKHNEAGGGGGVFNTYLDQDEKYNLVMDSCVVDSNKAPHGGGIFNDGHLQLINSTISNHVIDDEVRGAGIHNRDSLTVINCRIFNNRGLQEVSNGGGLYNEGAAILMGSEIYENVAWDDGGGIYNFGNLRATNCRISGNQALFQGGGIQNRSQLLLISCAITGNICQTGGGLNNSITDSTATAKLVNCTISGNALGIPGLSRGGNGGGIDNDRGTVTIKNTIIALNDTTETTSPDIDGVITSEGYNHIGIIGTGSLITKFGDIIGGEPGFMEIAPPAPTTGGNFNLAPGSAEIDTGDPDTTLLNLPAIDLAGKPRIANMRIDRGAYEFPGSFYSISGNVLYGNAAGDGNAQKPVANFNVEISRNGAVVDTIFSNAAGEYELQLLPADSTYRTRLFQPNANFELFVNPTDALIVFNAFLGKINLTGCQKLAADVDSSLSIQPTDALLIFNRFLGVIPSFRISDWRAFPESYAINADAEAWKFTPLDTMRYPTLRENKAEQNFVAVLRGDVNLSWTPEGTIVQLRAGKNHRAKAGASPPVKWRVKNSSSPEDARNVTLLIELENAPPNGLLTFGGELRFDARIMAIDEAGWGEIIPQEGFQLGYRVTNTQSGQSQTSEPFEGKLRFGGYSTSSKTIAENGVLLQIKARLVQEAGPNTSIPVQLTYATAAVRASESAENVFEEIEVEVSEEAALAQLPADFHLEGNYPNPFNPTTMIAYQLPEMAEVELTVHNALGQRVRALIRQKRQAGGYYAVEWDGRNESGQPASSGVYFYRMIAKGGSRSFTQIKKMLLLK